MATSGVEVAILIPKRGGPSFAWKFYLEQEHKMVIREPPNTNGTVLGAIFRDADGVAHLVGVEPIAWRLKKPDLDQAAIARNALCETSTLSKSRMRSRGIALMQAVELGWLINEDKEAMLYNLSEESDTVRFTSRDEEDMAGKGTVDMSIVRRSVVKDTRALHKFPTYSAAR